MSYDTELQFAIDSAEQACRLAREVQREVVAGRGAATKDDRSPVTVADLAIQVVVSRRLAAAFPDDGLLAEEDAETLRRSPEFADRVLELARHDDDGLTADGMIEALGRGDHVGGTPGRYWVLDPIDGTKGFLRGDQYAVALALVDGGDVVVGVLGCPNLPVGPGGAIGTVQAAVRGHGATAHPLDGGTASPITVADVDDPARGVLCESFEAAHAAHSDQAEIARRLGITAGPVRIDSQCKYAVVARGEASIYLRLPRKRDYREKVWDHAAGVLIVEEAGGRATDLSGQSLGLAGGREVARNHGIVVTNGKLHDAVLRTCREVLGL